MSVITSILVIWEEDETVSMEFRIGEREGERLIIKIEPDRLNGRIDSRRDVEIAFKCKQSQSTRMIP